MDPQAEASTHSDEPASSIADDLRNAFAEQDDETIEGEVEEVLEGVAETPEETVVGDITAESDDVIEGELEAADDGLEVEALVEPPEHWAAADKETFSTAPPELQGWLLDRHKQMEGDYTRKTQEVADLRRDYEPVQQMLAPYQANLQQMGVSPSQYIERLANADLMLSQNPIEGLKQVAQMYGIDLANLQGAAPDGDPGAVDPALSTLRQELGDLRQNILRRDQADAQSRQNTILDELQSFSEATDDSGQKAHPHFDEVMNDMVLLAQAERSQGKTPVIKELYERAVWANTSTREQMQTAQQNAAKEQTQKEARAKAAKAKKAGKSVTGSSGAAPTEELSLRAELTRQMNG